MRRPTTLLRRAACLALLLLGSTLTEGDPPPSSVGWRWEVRLDAGLTRAEVTWIGEGFRPRELVLAEPAAAAALAPEAPGEGPLGVNAVLTPRGEGRWAVEAPRGTEGPVRVGWTVDLVALAALDRDFARRVGDDWVTNPAAWFAAPARWEPQHRARVVFTCPASVEASVSWRTSSDGSWLVPQDAFVRETFAAFVKRPGVVLERAGTRARVHVLDAPHRATAAGIERWLTTAFDAVAALWHGRFPAPEVQVLVEPVRPGGDPVVFGEALLAGGHAVRLLLSAAAEDSDLPGEWIAVHELTHLGQPWIVPEDAWFMEGFVTWYQEVLRGRAGILSEQRAWQGLHAGFGRGRRRPSPRSIAEDSAAMHATHAYHRVYWAGAALALRLDVALRHATQGRRSLDDAMRLWSGDEFTARKGWRALELLAEADRVFGTAVCVRTVTPFLAASEFPPVDDLYHRLGLVVTDDDRIAFLPDEADPAAAALRRAIVAPPHASSR
jgi:hypothetical protein